MPTIEVPEFWLLRLPCTCPIGSLLAVIPGGDIYATEDQAWRQFYPQKREREQKQRQGEYVEGVDKFDPDRFLKGHQHSECTRPKEES